MSVVIAGNAAAGAIFTGSYDAAPLSDPLNNLSRVKLHTSLNYLEYNPARTLSAVIGTVATTPVQGSDNTLTTTYNVGAHGVWWGIPFISGYVVVDINGDGTFKNVPLEGSVPIYQNGGDFIWWNLALNETNVLISEVRSYHTMPVVYRTVVVYVSDTVS